MTDFYAILLNSLKKRDLWDSAERKGLYDHARRAMIKKLWAMRPSLSTDELQERMELFDAAVQQVEADIAIAQRFRQFGPGDEPLRLTSAYVPTPSPPVEEDNWAGDVRDAPIVEGRLAEPSESRRAPRPYSPPPDLEIPSQEHRMARRRHEPQQLGASDDAYGEGLPPYNIERWEETAPDWRTGPAEKQEEDEYREYDEQYEEAEEPVPAKPARRGLRLLPAAVEGLFPKSRNAEDRWSAPEPRDGGRTPVDLNRLRAYLDRSINMLRGQNVTGGYGVQPPASSPRRYLTGGAVALAVGLAIWGGFIILPLLQSTDVVTERTGDDGQAVAAEAPPVPNRITTTTVTTTSTAAPALAPPVDKLASLPVAERISIFDGRNPTIFTASSGNPIRYSGEGKFARIGSTAASPGARVTVGPGVAQRLAGKVVRIVVEARSSGEQGAATLRFGYQAGRQVSPWKSAPVGKGFAVIDFVWQVPPGAGQANNMILIEPGIAGSGTGVDIKSITLEVLKSA